MTEKRALDSEGAQPTSESKAARFNAHTLKKLQAAVTKDPEIDLTEQFPWEYPRRLMKMRTSDESSPSKHQNTAIQSVLIRPAKIIICQRKPNPIHRALSRSKKTSDNLSAHQTQLKLCFLFRMRLPS